MRLLLDSHILLWWSGAVPSRPTEATHDAIALAEAVFVSAATVWELEIKHQAGKLGLARLDRDLLDQRSIAILATDRDDACAAARLPLLHRDHFDGMIVAQTIRRTLTRVTVDRALAGYGVDILPA